MNWISKTTFLPEYTPQPWITLDETFATRGNTGISNPNGYGIEFTTVSNDTYIQLTDYPKQTNQIKGLSAIIYLYRNQRIRMGWNYNGFAWENHSEQGFFSYDWNRNNLGSVRNCIPPFPQPLGIDAQATYFYPNCTGATINQKLFGVQNNLVHRFDLLCYLDKKKGRLVDTIFENETAALTANNNNYWDNNGIIVLDTIFDLQFFPDPNLTVYPTFTKDSQFHPFFLRAFRLWD